MNTSTTGINLIKNMKAAVSPYMQMQMVTQLLVGGIYYLSPELTLRIRHFPMPIQKKNW